MKENRISVRQTQPVSIIVVWKQVEKKSIDSDSLESQVDKVKGVDTMSDVIADEITSK